MLGSCFHRIFLQSGRPVEMTAYSDIIEYAQGVYL